MSEKHTYLAAKLSKTSDRDIYPRGSGDTNAPKPLAHIYDPGSQGLLAPPPPDPMGPPLDPQNQQKPLKNNENQKKTVENQ